MAGTGVSGPQRASVLSPVTNAQAQTSYEGNQAALAQQQALVQALQAQNGIQNQGDVFNQLQQVAQGQGPNPAQAMLANATGANVANQAALMAGQRGAGANVGMIGRQAAQQGAATQQNAAGQAAALQAQQSLQALGGMGTLANQQAQQQIGSTEALTRAQQSEQQNLLNSISGQNQANVAMQSNINNANAGIATDIMGGQRSMFGNVMGAISGVPMKMADGGEIDPQPASTSYMSKYFNEQPMMAHGGKVPALVSPGEKYLSPQAVQQVKQGANPMAAGKTVPGKPKVGGAKNDYANDTVKAELDPGGIVLPRSVTKSNDANKKADAFVKAILAKHGNLPKRK